MKVILTILISCFVIDASAQFNYVYSGAELLNYGMVDLSLNGNVNWRTERSNKPGYFSVVDEGIFTGYSDRVHINGYVKKYGNSRFVFPVGNGNTLRALEISSPEKATDAYAVSWIDGDPSDSLDPTEPYGGRHSIKSLAGAITAVSNIGQWDWQVGESENLGIGTTGNGDGLNIRLTIPDMRNFAQASELRMVGWNGFVWIDLSGGATANGNTANSIITGTMIAGISAIGIGKVTDEKVDNDNNLFQLYPNPVINFDNVHIRFKSAVSGAGQIMVYDAAGKLVIRKAIQFNAGINVQPIEVFHLANGGYFINLIGSDGRKIFTGKKFIKQ